MNKKVFRLFVSSTFSDFTEERKLLQTVVFPEIKKYCSSKRLNFQPIDLRWGVSNEAQLDQKTLELCLDEVRSSKINPHPNFLIMAGDRYGWIPLPYLIEQSEFESILNQIKNSEDRNLLETWYKLDLNQIPASYILSERKDEFVDYASWEKVENQLRTILQTIVSNLNLSSKEKSKYFTSATEAEVEEGIFKYLDKTPFQNDLLNKDETLEQKDYEHVYAYIRNIETLDNETLKDKFKDVNPDDVNRFKQTLKESIKEENIYDVKVNLTNVKQDEKNNSLNYQYDEIKDKEKSEFVDKIITYLKRSIDEYSNIIKDLTPKELELEEQKRFKNDKLKDFLEGSRTKALNEIKNYIDGKNNQALVVYGKSGLGKSSLMAKAIENSEIKFENTDTKLIYKFVGSIATLTNTPEILISILNELNINEEIRKVINPQTMQEEPEKLEEFYYRIHDHLTSISQDTIIFLDAIDQLSNEDVFLWLPNELPKNLKIIISALDDENYPEDSKYLQDLKTKTINLYPLEEFDTNLAEQLILNILKRYDRTITKTQMDYLLNIYKDVKTPLYLSVAVQELRHWKSSDTNQTLATSQREIIKEFIENLTKLFHHDKEFVKRVFSYLYLSDGLSESELLEILSIDKEFIEYIAPDKYHKKESNELPVVIWARLHSQIKEFLKLEQKDNQEMMSFFHREFNEVIKNQEDIKEVHEHLILILQKLITKYQYEEFESNRWGKLYLALMVKHYIRYELANIQCKYSDEFIDMLVSIKENSLFFISLDNILYIKNIYLYCNTEGNKLKKNMHLPPHFLINYFLTRNIKALQYKYIDTLEQLSKSFYRQIAGIKFAKEALDLRESIFLDNEDTICEYINSLMNNASMMAPDKSIELYNEAVKHMEIAYLQNLTDHSGNLQKVSICYKDSLFRKIENLLEIFDNTFDYRYTMVTNNHLNILEEIQKDLDEIFYLLNEHSYFTIEDYVYYFYFKSKVYKRNNEIDKAINFLLNALEKSNNLFKVDKDKYEVIYPSILNDLGLLYKQKENYIKAIECQEKNVAIREKQFNKFPLYYGNDYLRALGNFVSLLIKYGYAEKAIEKAKLVKEIAEKHHMQDNIDYQYSIELLKQYLKIKDVKFDENNVEKITKAIISTQYGLHPEFMSLITLIIKNEAHQQTVYDNYVKTRFGIIESKLKKDDLDGASYDTEEFLDLLFPKLLETNRQFKNFYDYVAEILVYEEKLDKFLIYSQIFSLSTLDIKEVINYFMTTYRLFLKNYDLWIHRFIECNLNIANYLNSAQIKESSIFAFNAINLLKESNTMFNFDSWNECKKYDEYLYLFMKNSAYYDNTLLHDMSVRSDEKFFSYISDNSLTRKEDIFNAIKTSDHKKTEGCLLVNKDKDINLFRDNEELSSDDTLLHMAVDSNNIKIIKLLLNNRINVNKSNNIGETSLFYAVVNRNIEIIHLLLRNNANIYQKTIYGVSPYDYAIENDLKDIINIFKEYDQDELPF